MATVLFVMKYPLHKQENLKIKFDGQMAATRALGHEVYCIGWDETGMWLVGESSKELLRRSLFTGMPGYDHTKIFMDLMAAVREVLGRKHMDVVYLRYMPTFGGAANALKALKDQGGKLVLEYPTYPRERGTRLTGLRGLVFAYADRVLARIHPLVDLYALIGEPTDGWLDGVPAMNITNGIEVDSVPPHAPNPGEETVRLLAMASMAEWHGYDRVIRSLAAYQGETPVELHMVGPDGDGSLGLWKRLTAELGLEKQVFFHGPLYGAELNALIQTCDVGLGVLAMFRFGNSPVMALKLREYMARGLPFVNAAEDPFIPEDDRYYWKVSHDEAPIEMERIVEFAKRVKRDADIPPLMRAYAKERLSWESVMGSVWKRVGI